MLHRYLCDLFKSQLRYFFITHTHTVGTTGGDKIMFMNYVGMEIWVSQVFLDWVILSGYPSCQGTTLSGCKLSNFVPLTPLCLISLGQVK